MVEKDKAKKTVKSYGVGSLGIGTILCIIFGLVGAVLGDMYE